MQKVLRMHEVVDCEHEGDVIEAKENLLRICKDIEFVNDDYERDEDGEVLGCTIYYRCPKDKSKLFDNLDF